MSRASRVFAALVSLGVASGCFHYSATLPGVLDTRSDGSTAEASPLEVTDEELRRDGFAAVFEGAGVQADDAHVLIEERHFFGGITGLFRGAFLLSNGDPTPELEAAVEDDALRQLRVSHQASGLDAGLSVLVNLIPCVPIFLAPQAFTFTLSGERVSAGGRPPSNRPVAPPVESVPVPMPLPEDTDPSADPSETAPPAPEEATEATEAEDGEEASPEGETP